MGVWPLWLEVPAVWGALDSHLLVRAFLTKLVGVVYGHCKHMLYAPGLSLRLGCVWPVVRMELGQWVRVGTACAHTVATCSTSLRTDVASIARLIS